MAIVLGPNQYGKAENRVGGLEHNHSWTRKGQEVRTTILVIDAKGDGGKGDETLVSGFKDLVVLKSTGSKFHDFLVDEYTTLVPTNDRIMATSLTARVMLEQFATVHRLALQLTLSEMGRAVLESHADVAEIKFSAPNKHHFVYDPSPFGLDNPNGVFNAPDRPYGLIEATVLRNDAPPAGRAWDTVPGFV